MSATTQKTANYTAEMVTQMTEMYNEFSNDGLDEIADTLAAIRKVCQK